MKRNTFLSLCTITLALSLLLCIPMFAQNKTIQPSVITQADFNRPIHSDVSPPLRDLIDSQPVTPFGFYEASPALKPKLQKHLQYLAQHPESMKSVTPDGVIQNLAPVSATVGVNVLGVGVGFHGYTDSVAPPDTNMASGDWPGNQANAQVVQWVNVSYAVFRKSDGAFLAGPILGNTLWAGFGAPCSNHNSGDIVAQFDKMAHRWVLFQPVFTAPFAGCFAISTTPDALGTYYRYAFNMGSTQFPDYPKLGIQPEAYYQSQNIFNAALTAYLGVEPCAYNRAKMLVGDATAEQICTFDNSGGTLFDDGFLPADLDSPELPLPAGTPEVFLGSIDNFASDTNVYEYTYKVNFGTGSAVLTGINGTHPLPTGMPAFVGLCNFGATACIPQLGVATGNSGLDPLSDRLMYRLALHRTVNAANVPVTSYLVNHSINNGATGAVRWYEFRAPAGNPTALSIYQGGTYAPDATYRWMGSIAMDKAGNIALGYSRSSSTIHPDIYYTGRVPSDPLGTLEGEAAIVNQTVATGSQSRTSHRWGDYSSMSLDLDGCTFWYTTEYYTTTTTFAWSTRVASLKFPSCTPTVLP